MTRAHRRSHLLIWAIIAPLMLLLLAVAILPRRHIQNQQSASVSEKAAHSLFLERFVNP